MEVKCSKTCLVIEEMNRNETTKEVSRYLQVKSFKVENLLIKLSNRSNGNHLRKMYGAYLCSQLKYMQKLSVNRIIILEGGKQ